MYCDTAFSSPEGLGKLGVDEGYPSVALHIGWITLFYFLFFINHKSSMLSVPIWLVA